MNKLSNISTVIIIALLVFQSNTSSNYKSEIIEWQKEMNSEFKSPKTSPLTKEDLLSFSKLDYYDINESFKVEANLKLNKNQKEFGMKTTTDRLPIYVKYGVASFKLKGKELKINIYKNVELAKQEKYKYYLFMLFTDKTSGTTSYAGGRYIDLRIPEDGKHILIDFNKAYNPYCAYNHKYSCPIPSEEDHLDIEIYAGVKDFH